jgi:purine-binding chemotaxis protein CheW
MGRMADARKKARQKSGEEDLRVETPGPPPPEPEAGGSLSRAEAPTDPSFAAPRWVSSEETLSFPSEQAPPERPAPVPRPPPPPSAPPRISLPSSGLAAEILSQADVLGSEALMSQPPEPEAAVPPPSVDLVRAQSAAFFGGTSRDDRRAAPEQTEHLVTFYLADEEYALDVKVVQEIIRLTETTHVPRAPGFIKGVINLRGRIIPVVDLKRKLDLGEVAPSRLARIVVVKLRDRLIGLLVDGASQVLKIPVSSIEAAPEEILDVSISYIRGVAKLEKRLIILLDLYKVLAIELDHVPAQ